MKIAIYSQHTGKYTNSILSELFGFSDKYNIKFYLEKEFANILNRRSNIKLDYTIFSSHKDLDKSFNLMITIGGDGTLLRSISFVRNLEIPIIGICNGFQILTETGLLKGTLLRNKNLKFINKDVHIKVINNDTKFTNKYKNNQIAEISIGSNKEQVDNINFKIPRINRGIWEQLNFIKN